MFTVEEARIRRASNLRLEVESRELCDNFTTDLAGLLQPFRPDGTHGCRVAVKVVNSSSQGDVILGDEWRVVPHDDLLQNLKEHFGAEKVHLQYA